MVYFNSRCILAVPEQRDCRLAQVVTLLRARGTHSNVASFCSAGNFETLQLGTEFVYTSSPAALTDSDPGTEEFGKDVDSSGDLGADRSLGG
jgi:hypothetical protein